MTGGERVEWGTRQRDRLGAGIDRRNADQFRRSGTYAIPVFRVRRIAAQQHRRQLQRGAHGLADRLAGVVARKLPPVGTLPGVLRVERLQLLLFNILQMQNNLLRLHRHADDGEYLCVDLFGGGAIAPVLTHHQRHRHLRAVENVSRRQSAIGTCCAIGNGQVHVCGLHQGKFVAKAHAELRR